MDNLKQVKDLKKALDLEIFISKTQELLSNLIEKKFPPAPSAPVCEKIEKKYPEIVPKTKTNWLLAALPMPIALIIFIISIVTSYSSYMTSNSTSFIESSIDSIVSFISYLPMLLLPLSIAWAIVYPKVLVRLQQRREVEQIKNSNDYKARCYAIDVEHNRLQSLANARYQAMYAEYKDHLLPKYQEDLKNWTEEHNKKISETENKLKQAEAALEEHYITTKIIPVQYRTIEIMQYIYNLISTSNYDIKYAIDLYDRNMQQMIEAARLYEQQQANELAAEQAALLQEQNELAAEQNAIAEKARRDANIAAVVATVQRANISRKL